MDSTFPMHQYLQRWNHCSYLLVGVLAAVAVIFVVLFLRVRGKVSYFQLVVEDQIKDLEGLTLRASKIDRTMSSSLESVKDRLKRLVGM